MRLLLLFTLFCAFDTLSAQGPLDGYLKGKGKLDIATSFSYMDAKDFEGAQGTLYNEPYRGYLLSIFAEYGVTDRFDLVATVPYIFTSTQNGLQDGGLYAKYRILYAKAGEKGHLGIIAGMGASFPLSNYEPTATGALGQRAVAVPARLIAQWDTPWGPFVNLTGGYNWRLDQYKAADLERVQGTRPGYLPDDPPGYATFLFKAGMPAKHYYLDGWVEYQYTNKSKGTDFAPGVLDLPQAYGVSYTQVGGTIYYSEGGKRGVFLSGAKILNGRNVSRVFRFTGGIVLKY